jgi:hypothetical protein
MNTVVYSSIVFGSGSNIIHCMTACVNPTALLYTLTMFQRVSITDADDKTQIQVIRGKDTDDKKITIGKTNLHSSG